MRDLPTDELFVDCVHRELIESNIFRMVLMKEIYNYTIVNISQYTKNSYRIAIYRDVSSSN